MWVNICEICISRHYSTNRTRTPLKAQGPRTCNESKEEENSDSPASVKTASRFDILKPAAWRGTCLLLSSLELSDTEVYEP